MTCMINTNSKRRLSARFAAGLCYLRRSPSPSGLSRNRPARTRAGDIVAMITAGTVGIIALRRWSMVRLMPRHIMARRTMRPRWSTALRGSASKSAEPGAKSRHGEWPAVISVVRRRVRRIGPCCRRNGTAFGWHVRDCLRDGQAACVLFEALGTERLFTNNHLAEPWRIR